MVDLPSSSASHSFAQLERVVATLYRARHGAQLDIVMNGIGAVWM